jgi:hypothetical protein
VTEPGARATSVRRTVTVATALVASQAVLCGVIGWITFGGTNQPARSTTRAEPVLGPPIVVPPASVAPVVPPSSAHHHVPVTGRASGIPRPTSAPARTAAPPSPPRRTIAATENSPGLPATGRAGAGLVLPPTPSASETQRNAEVGKQCAPQDAIGLTAEDIAVLCGRDRDGNLIWQII